MAKSSRRQSRRETRQEKVVNFRPPTRNHPRHIEFVPKTEAQRAYYRALQENDMVVAIGCAGTGKTYCAMTYAAMLYNRRDISQIVLTRPNVAAGGKGLGFFPGDVHEKMSPWIAPALDVLKKHLGSQAVEAMIRCGEIVIEPFETMRGKSYDNAFIVLDEAQNATREQMKMFLTRIGEGSMMVVDGDVGQSDIRGGHSGLAQMLDLIDDQRLPVPVVEFTPDDIVRSGLCGMWVRAYADAA